MLSLASKGTCLGWKHWMLSPQHHLMCQTTTMTCIARSNCKFNSNTPPNTTPLTPLASLPLASYNQALAAVQIARDELTRLGEPHRRPEDYFADMIKTDSHMQVQRESTLQLLRNHTYTSSLFLSLPPP